MIAVTGLWGGYNYLAIGNSITLHRECEYWPEEMGMAASRADKDYVHLVTGYLEDKNEDVTTYAYNFSTWESRGYDRAEFLPLLDPYLSEDIDLITIQLSENVTDTSSFYEDYVELVRYIQMRAPSAQIIMIGDFWGNTNGIEEIKTHVSTDMDISYVDLCECWENEFYKSCLGNTVIDEHGIEHIIEHEGVAKHPSDAGMELIAQKIISYLK